MVTVCKFFLLFFNLLLFSPRGSSEKTNNKIFCFLAHERRRRRKKKKDSGIFTFIISNHIIHILKMSIAQLGSTTAVSVLYFVSRFSFFSLDSTFASL